MHHHQSRTVAAAPPPSRLIASHAGGGRRVRTCAECGEPHQRDGLFCSQSCRLAFNNRRLLRGAVLYDLFMALRFDRHAPSVGQAWRAMCRAAAAWRDEDHRQRAGRKSWRPPAEVLSRTPALFALVTTITTRKS